jgi:peptide/nickel transport system permease protein
LHAAIYRRRRRGDVVKTYIIKRLIQSIGVCLVISMISFFLLFLNTDPALLLLPPDAEVKDIGLFKKQMGLDRPIIIQYGDFLRKVVFHGDFGESFVAKVPALQVITERLPATIKLTVAVMIVALVGQAMPLYWFGIMLIIVFGVWLRWLPISGSDSLAHLVLPAVTLGSWILPVNMRLIRSGMLDVLTQDYIRTARAKGLTEKKVLIKHAFRNAAIPLITVLGMQISLLLGGAVVTETVFAWPGIGRLAVDSIRMGDYPVVQAVVVIFAFIVILSNLVADVLAALIDPRIRLE